MTLSLLFSFTGFFLAGRAFCLPAADQRVDDLLREGAAAYRKGRFPDALQAMTAALDLDPRNPTAKSYLWTITKKIQQEDEASAPAPGEKEKIRQLALSHLAQRNQRSGEIMESLKQAYQNSRHLRSPADLLSSRTGLERYLGNADAERASAQAERYFNDIL